MFGTGEYANEAPENELETALRLLRLKLRDRRRPLRADDVVEGLVVADFRPPDTLRFAPARTVTPSPLVGEGWEGGTPFTASESTGIILAWSRT